MRLRPPPQAGRSRVLFPAVQGYVVRQLSGAGDLRVPAGAGFRDAGLSGVVDVDVVYIDYPTQARVEIQRRLVRGGRPHSCRTP